MNICDLTGGGGSSSSGALARPPLAGSSVNLDSDRANETSCAE